MKFSFMEEGWTPNYVKLTENPVADSFLSYVESWIQPFKKENTLFVMFNFGERKLEIPCIQLEELLYELKRNEGNSESSLAIPYKEIADFFGYFNLIEQTKMGYLMVEDYIKKTGDASLATILGHILVEKHFPVR